MKEIHDPDFDLHKTSLKNNIDETLTSAYMLTNIYSLDKNKKGFVGNITSKVLSRALEEIFFRMVMPSDGVGPRYIGKIEPRHRFPDLSHPS